MPDAEVEIKVKSLSNGKALMNHYRIDQEHSNSYTLWKQMGSPQNPSPAQISELEKAGQLKLYSSPKWMNIKNGETTIKMKLPRQGISLLQFLNQ